MNITISKKNLIRIIVFTLVTALIVGMIVFIPKIQKMMEDAKWKKGIYILPVSEYHAFGIDEDTTITQLNFIRVRESEETFLNFLKEYHFFLSNDYGDEIELIYQESFHLIMQLQSIRPIKEGELYQHYSISFLIKFATREYREFNKIFIYKNDTEKKSIEIGRIIYDFYDYQKTTRPVLPVSASVFGNSFRINPRYAINAEQEYVNDSIMAKLTDATFDSDEIDSSELFSFPVNGVCFDITCLNNEYDPYFDSTNDFLTYTLKPIIKYKLNDVMYTDAYRFPIIYARELETDKYFEVASTFTNLL